MGDYTESFTLHCDSKEGGGGWSKGVRRKVSEFDLDRWGVILVEIFNRQIEIKRETAGLDIYWKLLNLEPGIGVPRIIIL